MRVCTVRPAISSDLASCCLATHGILSCVQAAEAAECEQAMPPVRPCGMHVMRNTSGLVKTLDVEWNSREAPNSIDWQHPMKGWGAFIPLCNIHLALHVRSLALRASPGLTDPQRR